MNPEILDPVSISRTLLDRRGRIDALLNRHERLLRVINARALDPAMQRMPGTESGLLVRKAKRIGRGKDAVVVGELVLDTAILKELHAIEDQVAWELAMGKKAGERDYHSKGTLDFDKMPWEDIRALRDIFHRAAERGAYKD